jgi:hypothetical protein
LAVILPDLIPVLTLIAHLPSWRYNPALSVPPQGTKPTGTRTGSNPSAARTNA